MLDNHTKPERSCAFKKSRSLTVPRFLMLNVRAYWKNYRFITEVMIVDSCSDYFSPSTFMHLLIKIVDRIRILEPERLSEWVVTLVECQFLLNLCIKIGHRIVTV